MLVFIDESGCSGFMLTRGADAVFAIGMVIFESASDAAQTLQCLLRLRHALGQKPEFKFAKSNDRGRDSFFHAIANCPFKFRALVYKKFDGGELPADLLQQNFRHFFLRQLLQRAEARLDGARITLDGKGSRHFERTLKADLRKHVRGLATLKTEDSQRDELLQLADMCVGAVARAFRHPNGCDKWLRVIAKRIEDISIFPQP